MIERAGKFVVNVEVGLDDFAGEGAEAAAFLVGAFVGDVVVRPFPKRVEVIEAGESFTAMEREDAFGLPGDDGQDEVFLGREVVIDLRSANAGGVAQLLVVRGVDTVGVDEFGCVFQDAGPRGLALVGQLVSSPNCCNGFHRSDAISNWGLTAQVSVVFTSGSGLTSPKSTAQVRGDRP